MDYIQLTMEQFMQEEQELKEDLGTAAKSFVRAGWRLNKIDKTGAYKLKGFKSVSEYAKEVLNMKPDFTSRLIRVYERYSLPGDTPELKEQYQDYNFSQLSEMLQLAQEDLQLIRPETKRADIRELNKFNKENENNPDNLLNWKQTPQDNLSKTILELFKVNKEILNDLYGSEAYQTGNLKEMVEIVNPSGNKSYRKGTVFLMFYNFDKGIMVKEFGQSSPYELTWERFFSITQSIFEEAAAGSRTWENYFGQKKEPENPQIQERIEPEQTAEKPEDGNDIPESQETEPEAYKETSMPPKEEGNPEEGQKIALMDERPLRTENHSSNPDFVSAQKSEKIEPECQETAQIPGQDSIENHPEYLPEPQDQKNKLPQEDEIAPAQPEPKHDVLDKPLTRKEYLDSLTSYGAADCIAKAFKDFRNNTYSQLMSLSFWEDWLIALVDHNGRPWID